MPPRTEKNKSFFFNHEGRRLKAIGVKQKVERPEWLAVFDESVHLMKKDEAMSFLDQFSRRSGSTFSNGHLAPDDLVACLIFGDKLWAIAKCEDLRQIPIPLAVAQTSRTIEKMPVVIWLLQK